MSISDLHVKHVYLLRRVAKTGSIADWRCTSTGQQNERHIQNNDGEPSCSIVRTWKTNMEMGGQF
jgi:hypothetical protein